jgi:hypothetical protein
VSKEREEVNVSTGTVIKSARAQELDERNEALEGLAESVIQTEMSRAEKKARLISVLERGIVHDRLFVPLPPEVHGEWVRDDPLEIARMQTLGFVIDHEYAPKRALHSDGSDVGRVGDVIFMTCDREIKEIVDEIRHEQFLRINAPSKSKEEEEMIANTLRESGHEVPTFSESKTHKVDRDQIADALRRADAQTQPIT